METQLMLCKESGSVVLNVESSPVSVSNTLITFDTVPFLAPPNIYILLQTLAQPALKTGVENVASKVVNVSVSVSNI